MRVIVHQVGSAEWRWELLDVDGVVLSRCVRAYESRGDAIDDVQRIRRHSATMGVFDDRGNNIPVLSVDSPRPKD